jgi:hypothetical protein
MTQKARIVLQDAQRAIANHTDALQSEEFRASWFAVVGLLRAVGHVLANEDARSSEGMKRAIEEKWAELWRTKPEPKIFWEFILHERNRFLKNYEHGIVRTRTQSQVAPDGRVHSLSADVANSRGGSSHGPNVVLESYISDGPYAGRPERQVAFEAHRWWQRYLDDVDALARKHGDV